MFWGRVTDSEVRKKYRKWDESMGRIALTEALLRNTGIYEGDSANLYFDAATKAIIIERTPSAEAGDASISAKRTNNKTKTP